MSATKQLATTRRDPLAISSFFIAAFLLGPVQGGVMEPGLRTGRYGTVILLFVIFFVVPSIPLWMSVRRRQREPLVWRSLGFLIATGILLGLDVLWFASTMVYQLWR